MTLTNTYWKKVDRTGNCWLWLGYTTALGYGRYNQQMAHRLSYEEALGPIPEGLELDHLCRVRLCVRPEHLEAVTHAENVRRGNGGRKPAVMCPAGHRYEGTNVYVRPDGTGRDCKACKAERVRRSRGRI